MRNNDTACGAPRRSGAIWRERSQLCATTMYRQRHAGWRRVCRSTQSFRFCRPPAIGGRTCPATSIQVDARRERSDHFHEERPLSSARPAVEVGRLATRSRSKPCRRTSKLENRGMSSAIDERRRHVTEALKRCYKHRSGDVQSDQAVDIIADIMHWCDEAAVDFGHLVRQARMHHKAERKEEANPSGTNRPH